MSGDPFDLHLPINTPLRRAAVCAARPLLRRMLRLGTLGALYAKANTVRPPHDGEDRRDPIAFATAALDVLDVRADADAGRAGVSTRGPLIVASNHPHGALDGLLLLDAIGRLRPDVRLVANHWLAGIPELRDVCFFVDPFDGRDSARRSLAGLRAAHLWLRGGGALLIFPAGEVAHLRRSDGSVVDACWRSTVGRLALGTGARVVPVHIDGENSRWFYAVGRLHPFLRTVLLPRELLIRRGCTVRMRFGAALCPAELAANGRTADAVTGRIREAVEQIRVGSHTARAPERARVQPVAPPVDAAGLDEDVRRLPDSARMAAGGGLTVYCAEAARIPHVLNEIGRLREVAFRAVGEGTGTASDLDAFDARYLHLFAWNERAREVVGAYRIGRADTIVASAGVEGLYTRTLFRYDETLLQRLPPALELGRSFVRPEYQRDPGALLLLWKGICAFVQRHPQYRVLFGAVSISARYSDRTRDMLMRFLEQNHLHQSLAEGISSLHPYPAARLCHDPAATVPATIAEADALTSQYERDGRGVPVLLRQYLKLNARVLGFNVDPSFGDALDALMMVDLTQVDVRILRRYFGPAGARAFLAHHATPHAA